MLTALAFMGLQARMAVPGLHMAARDVLGTFGCHTEVSFLQSRPHLRSQPGGCGHNHSLCPLAWIPFGYGFRFLESDIFFDFPPQSFEYVSI